MTWSEFYQSLKAGEIAPVYLFTGPEEYVKLEALSRLRQSLLPPGLEALNDMVLEGVGAPEAPAVPKEKTPFTAEKLKAYFNI